MEKRLDYSLLATDPLKTVNIGQKMVDQKSGYDFTRKWLGWRFPYRSHSGPYFG